jgi:hypothetical protein
VFFVEGLKIFAGFDAGTQVISTAPARTPWLGLAFRPRIPNRSLHLDPDLGNVHLMLVPFSSSPVNILWSQGGLCSHMVSAWTGDPKADLRTVAGAAASVGLGRNVALYHRSSTLHQIH